MKLSNPRADLEKGPVSIPMTSMIDVVFLLLIFFMVTATFAADEERLSSTLSAEGRAARAADFQPQIVRVEPVDGRPAFVIGENVLRTRDELADVLRRLPKEQGVVVRGSPEALVDHIAAAMQAAVDAGFTKRTYVPAAE